MYLPEDHHHRRHSNVPYIPRPEPKEQAVHEELVQPEHHVAERQKMVKPFEVVPEPRFNRMYGSLRTADGWMYVIDNYAKGGLTTVANTVVLSGVTLANTSSETRLSRWPGAVQLYLCIRSFSFALTPATLATVGSLDVYYVDNAGQQIPMGSIQSNDEINMFDIRYLIPTPFTDAGSLSQQIGSISATLATGATAGAYIWQIGFSYVYLLPETKGYEIQHMQDLMDGSYGITQHHR